MRVLYLALFINIIGVIISIIISCKIMDKKVKDEFNFALTTFTIDLNNYDILVNQLEAHISNKNTNNIKLVIDAYNSSLAKYLLDLNYLNIYYQDTKGELYNKYGQIITKSFTSNSLGNKPDAKERFVIWDDVTKIIAYTKSIKDHNNVNLGRIFIPLNFDEVLRKTTKSISLYDQISISLNNTPIYNFAADQNKNNKFFSKLLTKKGSVKDNLGFIYEISSRKVMDAVYGKLLFSLSMLNLGLLYYYLIFSSIIRKHKVKLKESFKGTITLQKETINSLSNNTDKLSAEREFLLEEIRNLKAKNDYLHTTNNIILTSYKSNCLKNLSLLKEIRSELEFFESKLAYNTNNLIEDIELLLFPKISYNENLLNLTEIVLKVEKFYEGIAKANDIKITFNIYSKPKNVSLASASLEWILIYLIEHALFRTDKGKEITLNLTSEIRYDCEYLQITLFDNGIYIAKDKIDNYIKDGFEKLGSSICSNNFLLYLLPSMSEFEGLVTKLNGSFITGTEIKDSFKYQLCIPAYPQNEFIPYFEDALNEKIVPLFKD